MGFKKILLTAIVTVVPILSGTTAYAQYPMEEKFLAETDRLFAKGDEWYDAGYALQADWYYAQAIVAVQSFKFAVSNIAVKTVRDRENAADAADRAALKAELDKGPETVDESLNDVFGFDMNAMLSGLNKFAKAADKLADKIDEASEKIAEKAESLGFSMDDDKEARTKMWNMLSGYSIASPYPYFFEGIVEQSLGHDDEAALAYRYAFSNPNMIRSDLDFSFLGKMTLPELRELYKRLDVKCTEYVQGVSLSSNSYERDWHAYSDAWQIMRGLTILKDKEHSADEAINYFDAAVSANPFTVSNFVIAAAAHIVCGDYAGAAEYINEGLLLDPGNSDLKEMVTDMKK